MGRTVPSAAVPGQYKVERTVDTDSHVCSVFPALECGWNTTCCLRFLLLQLPVSDELLPGTVSSDKPCLHYVTLVIETRIRSSDGSYYRSRRCSHCSQSQNTKSSNKCLRSAHFLLLIQQPMTSAHGITVSIFRMSLPTSANPI